MQPRLGQRASWGMAGAAALVLAASGAVGSQAQPEAAPQPGAESARVDARGRRVVEGPPTALGFRNVAVEEIVPFIVEVTGKVVMPQQAVMSRKVTILNDRPVPREQALDLVVLALQQNGIAVVETDTTVTLRDIGEITRQDVPVIGPEESVLDRTDLGTFAEKVFSLRHNTAKKMGDVIKNSLPEFAKLTIDEESNRVAVMGNISLLQRMERLITSLDSPSAGAVQTETFRLRYADAEAVKQNIEDLFGEDSSGTQRRQGTDQNRRQFFFPGQDQSQQPQASSDAAIRVTSNTQQNSVTVVADPAIMNQIKEQIEKEWDRPLPQEAVTPRVYELKHSDPVKVAAYLEGLFGRATTTTGGGGGQAQGNQQSQSAPRASQGVGRLSGQFSFQAIPDAGRLVVVAKSPDNLEVIDRIIKDIDQPLTAGLPEVIELKHANAEDLAEQLNALLAQEGTLAQIRRSEEGLSEGETSASPFATQTTTDTTTGDQQTTTTRDTISFWWQRARTPTDRRSASNLIAQMRIVPVWRQNALMVVSPPEYRASIVELIGKLDKPGRQVLISAIVAEVSREDATSLGLRWSSQAISPSRPDNSVNVGVAADAGETDFASSLFETSVLNVSTNVNLLLQALNENQKVNILSEPRIFTSDNNEAEFFSGQDIPFITDTQTTDNGSLNQSFDYRAVGIQLRARPRITVHGDVDLRVNLELSNIVPGETLFGGFIVDRRETTTQVIIKNGQTIVISGILREESTNIVRKVPLLGDIPLLGLLFKSKDTVKSNTELLVFVTPVVVNNTDENAPANEPYIERLDKIRETLDKDTEKLQTPGDEKKPAGGGK